MPKKSSLNCKKSSEFGRKRKSTKKSVPGIEGEVRIMMYVKNFSGRRIGKGEWVRLPGMQKLETALVNQWYIRMQKARAIKIVVIHGIQNCVRVCYLGKIPTWFSHKITTSSSDQQLNDYFNKAKRILTCMNFRDASADPKNDWSAAGAGFLLTDKSAHSERRSQLKFKTYESLRQECKYYGPEPRSVFHIVKMLEDNIVNSPTVKPQGNWFAGNELCKKIVMIMNKYIELIMMGYFVDVLMNGGYHKLSLHATDEQRKAAAAAASSRSSSGQGARSSAAAAVNQNSEIVDGRMDNMQRQLDKIVEMLGGFHQGDNHYDNSSHVINNNQAPPKGSIAKRMYDAAKKRAGSISGAAAGLFSRKHSSAPPAGGGSGRSSGKRSAGSESSAAQVAPTSPSNPGRGAALKKMLARTKAAQAGAQFGGNVDRGLNSMVGYVRPFRSSMMESYTGMTPSMYASHINSRTGVPAGHNNMTLARANDYYGSYRVGERMNPSFGAAKNNRRKSVRKNKKDEESDDEEVKPKKTAAQKRRAATARVLAAAKKDAAKKRKSKGKGKAKFGNSFFF